MNNYWLVKIAEGFVVLVAYYWGLYNGIKAERREREENDIDNFLK